MRGEVVLSGASSSFPYQMIYSDCSGVLVGLNMGRPGDILDQIFRALAVANAIWVHICREFNFQAPRVGIFTRHAPVSLFSPSHL